eukprot:3941196-Rhodomonas_salina.3
MNTRRFLCLLVIVAAFDVALSFSVGTLPSAGIRPLTGLSLKQSVCSLSRATRGCTSVQTTPFSLVSSGASTAFVPSTCFDGGSGGGNTIMRSGGGGGDGEEEDEDEAEVAALLKKYNLQMSDLPEGALALPAAKLAQFIESYANAFNRFLINTWGAWRDKMLADPQFAYKMMVEETVGLGLAMSGTVAARGKDLLKELDFFLTDCAVGAVLNFVLIWSALRRNPLLNRVISQQLAKLPAFIFAEGKYTLAQRAGAGLYKGSLFGACGFVGSVGGTSLAYMLFLIRQMANPDAGPDS